jgi:hypothetical protein
MTCCRTIIAEAAATSQSGSDLRLSGDRRAPRDVKLYRYKLMPKADSLISVAE